MAATSVAAPGSVPLTLRGASHILSRQTTKAIFNPEPYSGTDEWEE